MTKTVQYLMFYLIVLAVYVPLHYYLFARMSQALPAATSVRVFAKVIFIVMAVSYFGGRLLEKAWSSPLSDVFIWAGSFWLAIFVYGLMIVLLIDLVRLADYAIPFLPASWFTDSLQVRSIILTSSLIAIFALLLAGFINARSPRVRILNVHIAKEAGDMRQLNVVMASDLHLGHIVGKRRASRIVDKINQLNPDLILLAGDVIDEDISPVLRKDLGARLNELNAVFGVYAIPGNHEHIGGIDKAADYLQKHNIAMLCDAVVLINEQIYLVGREDMTIQRFTGKRRMELPELMKEMDLSKPIILIDHQPFHLEQAMEAGVDLQLSGHTHGGQIWPFNYIVDALYEIGTGYGTRGDTHYYVSSGAGTWGPPIRIGTRPEIVRLKLTFGL